MALPLPAQDAELVTLARRGREDAFGALYEKYFDGVYDFLTRLLRDRQEAADVAQDTFIKAFERLGHLEKPESFKSWLFTIAHRNGLNRIERSKRAVAVGDFYVSDREATELGVIDPDRAGDPERSAEAQAAARLIWEAAAGLDPKTYSVMDLHVRQGLDSAEIAEVLGVSKSNAYTMVSRMKKSFTATLATYLLVRKGSADCPQLAAIVAAEEGAGLTPQLRKDVDRHAKSCEVCDENLKVLFLPIKMFAALAAAPIPAGLEAAIWGSVQTAAVGSAAVAAKEAVAATAPASAGAPAHLAAVPAATGASSGSPAAVGAGGGSGFAVWLKSHVGPISLAAILVIVLFVGGAVLLDSGDDGAVDVLSAGVTATSESPSTTDRNSGGTNPSSTAPSTTNSSGTVVPGDTTTAPPVSSTTSEPPPSTTSEPPPTTTEPPPPTTTEPPPTTVPPFVVRDDAATVAEDDTVLVDVLANDAGYAPGAVPQIVTAPTRGTAQVSLTSILYAPNPDYFGSDQLAYSIRGRDGSTRVAQVSLTVTGVNDAPQVPGPGILEMAEDGVISFDPLAGAFDVDGDVLEMTAFDPQSEHGGAITPGSLVYRPATDWYGEDTFGYTVSDGTVDVTVAVLVSVSPVNDPPRGPAPVIEAVEDETATGNILSGWHDVEGDLVFVDNAGVRTTEKGGTADVRRRGAVTYTPPPNFTGVDFFAVSISDGTDAVAVSVRVNVSASNDPPSVGNTSFTVGEDFGVGNVIGRVMASDPDGDDVHFEALSQSVFEIRNDGTLVLTEPLDFEASDRHRLDARAVDEHGAATDFFVVLFVTDVDEAPVIADTTFTVPSDAVAGTAVGTVMATDPEGRAITFRLQGAGGVITIAEATGLVSLLVDADPADFPLSATVIAADPAGNTGRATVTLVLDDVDGPGINDFDVDVDAFYEPPVGGGVCPSRPRSATYTATVTDPSGVLGADLLWRITVAGEEISGVAKMSLVDDRYVVEFTAPAGILVDGNSSTLWAKVKARDALGNFSETAEIGVTLLPCLVD